VADRSVRSVRLQSEAAQAQVYASEQGHRVVILRVVTSVATGYINLRALDRQLEISRATAENYAGTQRIFDLRFKGGVVCRSRSRRWSRSTSRRSPRSPRSSSRSPRRRTCSRSCSAAIRARSRAAGRSTSSFRLAFRAALPSSLLERRPDILQAEQTLVAANANIGVAKSLNFPTLSLTGLLGSVSTAFGDFLSGPATAWSVAGGLAGPIFTFGAIEGQVQTAEAFQREALANYQQVVLNAFRETNDALVGSLKKREESEAQSKRVASLREYARLSRLKFDNGYAGYLEVLYADNELFSAELAAVRSQAEHYTELVNVYKAMGGGWVDQAERLAAAPGASADARAPATP
jgi:outer membrane protein, multidrug efflux system